MNYSAAIYTDYGSGCNRWAVYCKSTGCYYFANRYGKTAAQRLANKLNKSI